MATDYILARNYADKRVHRSAKEIRRWVRPARVFAISCNAGRFNCSWDNASGRRWIFPAGTVLYSDGVTPIMESTDRQPDVIIPVGGGTVYLSSTMWQGEYSFNNYDTRAIYTGDLADLPPLTYFINLAGCSNLTGDLADLPPLTYSLNLLGCYNITGDLADLPLLTSTLSLADCSNVTGDLADLPPLTYYLHLRGCSNVTGDLADLLPITYRLDLTNCSNVTGAYTAVFGDNVPTLTYLDYTGLSATDMDNTLIAYAACTKNNGTFQATGMTRTAASDAAVADLTARGWTIEGITKV